MAAAARTLLLSSLSFSSLIVFNHAVLLDVTRNAEWASGRDNYAHFLLAGVASITQALERVHLLSEPTLHLQLTLSPGRQGLWRRSEDGETSLLRQWEGRMNEVFNPWTVNLNDTTHGLFEPSSPSLDCTVPHLSFCDPQYWDRKFPLLRSFLRSRPPFAEHYQAQQQETPTPHEPPLRIFVVLRSDLSPATGRAGRDIIGLHEACESYVLRRKGGSQRYPSVECGSFSSDQPLTEVAKKLSAVDVLMGAHGAGLSNMLFLPDGAAVIELDSTANVVASRPFFQHLATSLSLPAEKIWLDFPRGRRHFEASSTLHGDSTGEEAGDRLVLPPLQHCRRFRPGDNSSIDDKSSASLKEARILPYTGKARITDAVFAQLIDSLAAKGAQRGRERGTRDAVRRRESSHDGSSGGTVAFCGPGLDPELDPELAI